MLVLIDDYGNLSQAFEGSGAGAALFAWLEALNRVIADGRQVGVHTALTAGRRAVSAALAMALATHEFSSWLEERFGARGLPPFAIGVGLHAGEVTICRLGTIQNKETTPIGDTVNVAARLEASSKQLGWTVVASSTVLDRAGEGVQTGGNSSAVVDGAAAAVLASGAFLKEKVGVWLSAIRK